MRVCGHYSIPCGGIESAFADFELIQMGDIFRTCDTVWCPACPCARLFDAPGRPGAKNSSFVPFFSYQQLLTSSRACLTCSLTILVSSRSCPRCPPVQALRLTRSLPSGDLGPVDCFHGFHNLIDSACLALRSGVHPLLGIFLSLALFPSFQRFRKKNFEGSIGLCFVVSY